MTEKEKAKELYRKCERYTFQFNKDNNKFCVKKLSLIIVDEIIEVLQLNEGHFQNQTINYWEKVKYEIEES